MKLTTESGGADRVEKEKPEIEDRQLYINCIIVDQGQKLLNIGVYRKYIPTGVTMNQNYRMHRNRRRRARYYDCKLLERSTKLDVCTTLPPLQYGWG